MEKTIFVQLLKAENWLAQFDGKPSEWEPFPPGYFLEVVCWGLTDRGAVHGLVSDDSGRAVPAKRIPRFVGFLRKDEANRLFGGDFLELW